MAILMNPTRSILFANFAQLMLSCRHHTVTPSSALTALASFLIRLLSCFGLCECLLAAVCEDFFSIDFKWALLFFYFPPFASNHPIFRLAHFTEHCSCSDFDKISHITTVGPSSCLQTRDVRFLRPADWKKGAADITASPSSLLALWIFCSARSIDTNHVGDLYPASSFSCMLIVYSWISVIRSCSRSKHRFRRKIQLELLLAIVHPVRSSMHLVRLSVVLVLVLPKRSSQSNDSSRILTNPPFGCDSMSGSKNHVMPISTRTFRSSRSRGSSVDSNLVSAFRCIRCITCAGPFVLNAFSW